MARQQEAEGGRQRHEERAAGALGEGEQGGGGGGVDDEVEGGALVGGRGRTRTVGGQGEQGRRAVEARAPVVELAFQGGPGQPLALPMGVVGVLERECGQRRGEAGAEGGVERGDLAHEDPHRPAVAHDVVQREEHQVVVVGHAQQARAHERAGGEVERGLGLVGGDPACARFALGGRQRAEIVHGQRQGERVGEALEGRAVGAGEGGAQGFVAADEFVDGALQRGRVQGAAQAQRLGHVVGGAGGVELVEEPEALLGERERQGAVAGHGHQRGRRGGRVAARGFDACGQRGHGG